MYKVVKRVGEGTFTSLEGAGDCWAEEKVVDMAMSGGSKVNSDRRFRLQNKNNIMQLYQAAQQSSQHFCPNHCSTAVFSEKNFFARNIFGRVLSMRNSFLLQLF